MIKSARVMKKAVAHLIPFMEEERALKAQELKDQGLEITDDVNRLHIIPPVVFVLHKELVYILSYECARKASHVHLYHIR